jgi:hypothetical protein
VVGDLDVGVGQDELANHRVEREAVDAVAEREDHHRRGGVEAVARAEELVARLADVRDALGDGRLGVLEVVLGEAALLGGRVDPEDRADRDAAVEVGGAVERVKDDDVLAARGPLDRDGRVLLLRGDHARAARGAEAVAEDLVRDDVELLLRLARDVLRAREARQVGDARARDERADLLARERDGGEDRRELRVDATDLLLLKEPGVERVELVLVRRRGGGGDRGAAGGGGEARRGRGGAARRGRSAEGGRGGAAAGGLGGGGQRGERRARADSGGAARPRGGKCASR